MPTRSRTEITFGFKSGRDSAWFLTIESSGGIKATSIASVAFVRPGSVTHTFDESQRYVPLAFTLASTHLDVDAPETPNIAPPGYYMLFLVDQNGVPSVAEFVLLGASAGEPVPGLSGAGLALLVGVLIGVTLRASRSQKQVVT